MLLHCSRIAFMQSFLGFCFPPCTSNNVFYAIIAEEIGIDKHKINFEITETLFDNISDVMEKNADIREIVRRLMLEDKQVTMLGYVERKDVQSPILPQSRMLGWKDRNWLHQLSKDAASSIAEAEHDIVIDLTQTYCLPLHYAALFARAKFKVGRHIMDGLHDFDIEMPEQEIHTPLFDQIVHYIQTIESKD